MTDRDIDICEKLGWIVNEYEDFVNLATETPAGEDYRIDISSNNFVKGVEEAASEFDIDDHVLGWAGSLGRNGVPNSIEILVNDAKWIQSELEKLAFALNHPEKDFGKTCSDCGHLLELRLDGAFGGQKYWICELNSRSKGLTDSSCLHFCW